MTMGREVKKGDWGEKYDSVGIKCLLSKPDNPSLTPRVHIKKIRCHSTQNSNIPMEG